MVAIDGIVSGMDTTALINSLMQIEALPQASLKTKLTSTQSLIGAFQKLNAAIAKIGDLAKATQKPDALDVFKSTSTAESVSVTAAAGASAGDLQFEISQTASAHRIVSAPLSQWPDSPPVLTFTKGTETTTVTASSASLADIASAVEAADVGITVSRVAAGKDGSGNTLYRLQFTSTETGAENTFTVSRGSGAGAVNLEGEGATVVQNGQDAEIVLWAGTDAEQMVASATNTFEEVLTGVDVTISKVEADPVSVTIARDEAKAAEVVKTLVTAIGESLAFIAAQSAVTTTASSGGSATRGGLFTGDSTVRDAASRLRAAATDPVGDRSPSEVGIVLTRTGAVEFDAEKFAKAMHEDPARVAGMVAEIAGRVQEAAAVISDKYEGILTSRITGQESLVRDLNTRILDWDRRLEMRRATLERTYTAMEVQLGTLNSQSSWLTSQLAGLPTGNSST